MMIIWSVRIQIYIYIYVLYYYVFYLCIYERLYNIDQVPTLSSEINKNIDDLLTMISANFQVCGDVLFKSM